MYRFKRICVTVWAAAVLSAVAQAQALQQGAGGVLPGTNAGAFASIQGNALNSTGGPQSNTGVRLRDARLGGVVDTQRSDRSGLFAFRAVDPGSYVVELVADDQTILAASEVLNVNAGEVASAVVQLPFHIAPFAGILGQSAGQAAAVIATAVAAGVLVTHVSVDDVSPE